MPPLLARLDVGQVDLDGRQPGDLDRVAQRPRVVRPGAGVEQQPVGVVGGAVQLLDELALEVGLEEARLEPELVRELADLALELRATRARRRRSDGRRSSMSRLTPCMTATRLRISSRQLLDRGPQVALRDAAARARAARRLDQHEAHAAAAALLVALDGGGHRLAVDGGVELDRQAPGGQQLARPPRAARAARRASARPAARGRPPRRGGSARSRSRSRSRAQRCGRG